MANEERAVNAQAPAAGLRGAVDAFRLLAESVEDYAIFMLDPSGRVVSWNRGAERFQRYRADEIVGAHFSTFYTDGDVQSGLCERALAIAAREGRFEDEGFRVRKDGTLFWANVVITALRDSRGRLLGFAKVTRDLTERRAAEKERLLLAEAAAARASAERALLQLERLQALTAAVAAANSPADLAQVIVRQGAKALAATSGLFWKTRGSDRLVLSAAWGVAADSLARYTELDVNAPLPPARAFKQRSMVSFACPKSMVATFPELSGSHGDMPALVAVPLILGERNFGVMAFGYSEPTDFSLEQRALLETFAARAAGAIDRIDIFEREVTVRQRLESLARASEMLAAAGTTPEVARVVLDGAASLVGADVCALYDYDPESRQLRLLERRGEGADPLDGLRRSAPGYDIRREQRLLLSECIWIEDCLTPSPVLDEHEPPLRALCRVPLRGENETFGALCLGFQHVRRFPPSERDFIETFARHGSYALLRTRRLEEERAARMQAEALQASLATTLRSIGDAVIATDRAGNVTFMNAMAEALTQTSEAGGRGRALAEVFQIADERTREPLPSPAAEVLRTGAGGPSSYASLSVSSGPTPIEYSGSPIRGRGGRIDGVVLVFRDVSERRFNEARQGLLADAASVLADSSHYRETLAQVAQMTVPYLADLCVIDLQNEGSESLDLVAVAAADEQKADAVRRLAGMYPARRCAPLGASQAAQSGRSELYVSVSDELLEAAADPEQLALVRSLGLVSALVVPLVARGRVLGAVSFAYSESGRVYTERDRAFAEDLARRCAVAVDNAALYAAEQRARTNADVASRAKDEFLAMVSHELRTPLNAIMGWSRLMAAGGLDETRQKRAVETIERNSVAMAQLIEDLLDVSRIISGKMRLNVRPVDLAAVVEGAIDSTRPAADAREVRIVANIDRAVGFVNGDQNRLQQVVWNLLSNAVKFTGTGGRIDVEAARTDDSVYVRVKDTGRGIAPEFLPQIFVPFRQERGAAMPARGGLGLGLAITRQLVELHGGTILAESEGEGRGATFTLHLPIGSMRRVSPPPSQTGRQIQLNKSFERPSQLEGLRVLAVDDDLDARELIQMLLENCGCEVTLAAGADEAMDALARARFDLLISDIGMPEQDGYDLIRRVRALPATRGGSIPAAALTAYARTEDRNRALSAGFSMHLPKPVEPAELVGAVVSLARFASNHGASAGRD